MSAREHELQLLAGRFSNDLHPKQGDAKESGGTSGAHTLGWVAVRELNLSY